MVKHVQTIRLQKPTNCLSVFDHFVGLSLNRLRNVVLLVSFLFSKHGLINFRLWRSCNSIFGYVFKVKFDTDFLQWKRFLYNFSFSCSSFFKNPFLSQIVVYNTFLRSWVYKRSLISFKYIPLSGKFCFLIVYWSFVNIFIRKLQVMNRSYCYFFDCSFAVSRPTLDYF